MSQRGICRNLSSRGRGQSWIIDHQITTSSKCGLNWVLSKYLTKMFSLEWDVLFGCFNCACLHPIDVSESSLIPQLLLKGIKELNLKCVLLCWSGKVCPESALPINKYSRKQNKRALLASLLCAFCLLGIEVSFVAYFVMTWAIFLNVIWYYSRQMF